MQGLLDRTHAHRLTRRKARQLIRDLIHGQCERKRCGSCEITGGPCRVSFFPGTCPVIQDLVEKK